MPHGYSHYTVTANKDADAGLLGVRLGRVCIKHNVPVATVAQEFGVTRQTVYNWFAGTHEPSPQLVRAVLSFIHSLA